MTEDQKPIPRIQRIIAVMWPSFLTAGMATGLFFSAFDPRTLLMDTAYADMSRLGAYTIGFFLFWALTAFTGLLTCYYQRPCVFQD